MSTNDILANFPGGLFLTIVGVTYLFAIAQNNGTIDLLVRGAVRMVGSRVALIPWVMFAITAVITAVGALSPAAVAIIAPIALSFAAKYKISPLMMGMMVIHGAQAGGFSPIAVYGVTVNGIIAKTELEANPMAIFLASFIFNLVIALVLFIVLGGSKLLSPQVGRLVEQAAETRMSVSVGARAAGVTLQGSGSDISSAGVSAKGTSAARSDGRSPRQRKPNGARANRSAAGHHRRPDRPGRHRARASRWTSASSPSPSPSSWPSCPRRRRRAPSTRSAGPPCCSSAACSPSSASSKKPAPSSSFPTAWPHLGMPLLAALLICYIGAVVSAFASSTAILAALIPLAVPFLATGEIGAVGVIAALAVASTIVDVSPFSTNGALVLANAPEDVDKDRFYKQILAYSGIVVVAGPGHRLAGHGGPGLAVTALYPPHSQRAPRMRTCNQTQRRNPANEH